LSESVRNAPTRNHRALALVALALVTGAAWMLVVPPFEGPDELFFYNRTWEYARLPRWRGALFERIAAPVVRTMAPMSAPAMPEYNPAFHYVGNGRGEVNRFVHERAVASREHVRALVALRGIVVLLSAVTVLLIYATARAVLGDPWKAFLVAAICLWIPQFSFMSAVVHPEVVTRLLAAAVTLVVVLRATGQAPRWVGWVFLPLMIAMVPLAERQALFLVPFGAIGLIATERSWKARAVASGLVVVPAAAAFWLLTRYTEADTDFGRWIDLLFHPLRPLLEADPTRGSIPPDAAYYAFEFLPKLFTGFWGWMGQPSILLPAWAFAALVTVSLVSLAGLALRFRPGRESSSQERSTRAARFLMTVGIALMCLPIVYGPAIAGRNLWYGRWLFAMLGPIVIGLVLGVTEFVVVARRWPRRVAGALAAVTLAGWVLWISAAGDALRTAIVTNHYGDGERFIATLRDSLIALAMLAAVVATGGRSRSGSPRIRTYLPGVVAGIGLANAILLWAFIRPLYMPLLADEYATLISKYLAANDNVRAADIYASAVKSYPTSGLLRRLGDDKPRLLLGGASVASRALLWDRLARGNGLDDRDALLMLAHEAQDLRGNFRSSDALNAALSNAEQQPDLAEPAALVRLAINGGEADRDAGRRPIEAGRGLRIVSPVRNGEIVIEGFTIHPLAGGRTQLIVYFRPRVEAVSRRLWLHAYPVGSPEYLDVQSTIAPATWRPGDLAWAAFELPPGVFNTYVGVWVGTDLGVGTPLGVIP
jgi:hypothetical protein